MRRDKRLWWNPGLRSAGAAGIQDRDAALPDVWRPVARITQVRAGACSFQLLLLLPRLLLFAAQQFGGGLLLTLHGLALSLLSLRLATCQRLALDALLAQGKGIAFGRPARLLHPLGVRDALHLLVLPGLGRGTQLLVAPGLGQHAFVAPRLGFLAAKFRSSGLLLTLGQLLALGKLGTSRGLLLAIAL